jgi:hypothetical protein
MRRALLLLLVGSALTLLAASRTWVTRTVDHGPALPLETIRRTGLALEPGLRPAALVGLASVLAVVATRAWGRTAIGLIATWAGGLALGASLQHAPGVWSLASALGGLLVAVGGVLTMLRGHRWGGLSEAYRTPAARAEHAPATDKGVWDALDRGEDPTADPHG